MAFGRISGPPIVTVLTVTVLDLVNLFPALSVTVVSPTELRVLSPPHSRGVVNVSVENPGAPVDVEEAGFVYVGMPRVTPRPGETRVLTRSPGD